MSNFKLNFPIETPEAYTFWASKHKCNRIKAIVAFSYDVQNANDNLRRHGLPFGQRLRALRSFSAFINNPSMTNVPFSEAETPWYECMPGSPVPPTKGHWAVWDDTIPWKDGEEWKEWIEAQCA